MNALYRYDHARRLLAEARTIDEVKDVIDRAERMRLYARQANDRQLMADAADIQLRATERLGEMIKAGKAAGEIVEGRPKKTVTDGDRFRVTLDDIGVTKRLSGEAQKYASLSGHAFEAMVQATRDKILSRGAVVINPTTTEDKKERRAAREAELADKILALPDKRYAVILADPEWRFEPYSRETGMDRAPENHYPTSVTDTIAARPVAQIAANDCALFLWATVPMLPDALRVMSAWGFEYKSHLIAVKNRIGTGYWFRNEHELLLVGTKGHVPAPAMGTQWPSTREFQVTRHSEKPDWQYELIEAYFPTLPKIELNARRRRDGWDTWGLDAPPHDPETGEVMEAAE